ncbi:MAG: hypothetical protein K2X97_06085, partial [Mycobacteriaceae bacterium]|nr:hypothetical protein [Mycobacteriaceae bacterium]
GRRSRQVPVRVMGAFYDPDTMTVTLVLRRRLDLNQQGRLRIVSNARRGLTDAKGQPMTNAQGRPADYLTTFGGRR